MQFAEHVLQDCPLYWPIKLTSNSELCGIKVKLTSIVQFIMRTHFVVQPSKTMVARRRNNFLTL